MTSVFRHSHLFTPNWSRGWLKSGRPTALNSRLSTWAAVDQWRRRLRACVRAKGGHFRHSLLTYWLRWFCQPSVTLVVMITTKVTEGWQNQCNQYIMLCFLNVASLSKNAVVTFIFILVLVLQGNAATKLRCGGKFYSKFIRKWFLVTTLKELLQSANIYQNYSKNKSGTVFLTHRVLWATQLLSSPRALKPSSVL